MIRIEHGGLKEDGTPDKRVGTGQFAQGQVDPVEAGKLGGHTSGSGQTSDESGGSGGSAKGGVLYSSILYFRNFADVLIEFAHGKVDPAEAGAKGGRAS